MVRDRRARRRTDMLGVALAMHTVPSDARLVGRRGRRLVDGDVVVHPPPCEIKRPAYGFVLTNSVARGVISRHPIWDGLGTGGVLLLFAQLETSPLGSVCIRLNDLSLRRRTSLPRTTCPSWIESSALRSESSATFRSAAARSRSISWTIKSSPLMSVMRVAFPAKPALPSCSLRAWPRGV